MASGELVGCITREVFFYHENVEVGGIFRHFHRRRIWYTVDSDNFDDLESAIEFRKKQLTSSPDVVE